MKPDDRPQPREALERQLLEIGNLYDIARALIGPADPERIAANVALAAMGTLGARSGALLLAAPRRRLRVAFRSGPDASEAGGTFAVEPAAWDWLRESGVFRLANARSLGELRAKLGGDLDAVLVAPIAGQGDLLGLLIAGPHLFGAPYDDDRLTTLEAIAALAALALGEPAEAPAVPAPAAAARPVSRGAARSMAALRAAHPVLRALVGDSDALHDAVVDLVAVAPTRYPVLLTGESGVGKELAARAIHEVSDRRDGPMEVVDCGSIPRELIESELFGHVRGAFTGAHRDRRGAFELAHHGTLFLDEIGEMPLQLQTRLLRVLQEGRFRRVGDEQPVDIDVRIVAATNRDPRAEVAAGRFRQDLFYRLNVFAVRIPALRERAGDLPTLMRHFLDAARGGSWQIDPAVFDALARHAWPGNIRELANLCSTIAVRARASHRIGLEDLEHVWRRQYGDDPPWSAEAAAPRGRLGDWALAEARRSRFNLVDAARRLAKEKRAGRSVPITERSALSYYVTGEVLRAIAEARGDADAATRAIAGDVDLEPRVAPRVARVIEALKASGSLASARRRFGKLPSDYEKTLAKALEAI